MTTSRQSDGMFVRRFLVAALWTCLIIGIWNFMAGKWLSLSFTSAFLSLFVVALASYRKNKENKSLNSELDNKI